MKTLKYLPARSIAACCGVAGLLGLSGCSDAPSTVSPADIRVVQSTSTPQGAPQPQAVSAIFKDSVTELGLDDVAIAIAVSKLPANASEDQITAAASQLLGEGRAIAPPFENKPNVANVDFARPEGQATIEDAAVIAAAIHLPFFIRSQENFLAFTASNILIPRGSIQEDDILAVPSVSLPNQQGNTVSFGNNTTLETIVRENLGLQNGVPIPAVDAASLSDLVITEERNLSSLEGIENLINLRRVILFNNPIESFSPLTELPQLRELRIARNRASDFTSLRSLSQLEVLELSITNIADISVLRNLRNLTELKLNFNNNLNSNSFDVFRNLNQLERLEIEQAGNIEDLSFLAPLTSLQSLNLTNNSIQVVDPLANLTTLTQLTLESNAIADISALSSLTQLQELNLADNPLSDIAVLETLPNILNVNLEGSRVSNLQPLADNQNLATDGTVNVSFNPLDPITTAAAIAVLVGRGVTVVSTPLPEEPFNIEIEFVGGALPAGLSEVPESLRDDVRAAAERWERAITRGLPGATFEREARTCGAGIFPITSLFRTAANPVDDLLIQVLVDSGLNGSSAGRGGPCVVRREGQQLPTFGTVRFAEDFVTDRLANGGDIINVATHEIGHVLGIGASSKWDSRVTGSGSNDPQYAGDRGREEYEALGAVGNVPVQINVEAHWRSEALGTELMTPANGENISRVSLGALADFGYDVDFSAADEFQLPVMNGTRLPSFSRPPRFTLYDDVERGPIYFAD